MLRNNPKRTRSDTALAQLSADMVATAAAQSAEAAHLAKLTERMAGRAASAVAYTVQASDELLSHMRAHYQRVDYDRRAQLRQMLKAMDDRTEHAVASTNLLNAIGTNMHFGPWVGLHGAPDMDVPAPAPHALLMHGASLAFGAPSSVHAGVGSAQARFQLVAHVMPGLVEFQQLTDLFDAGAPLNELLRDKPITLRYGGAAVTLNEPLRALMALPESVRRAQCAEANLTVYERLGMTADAFYATLPVYKVERDASRIEVYYYPAREQHLPGMTSVYAVPIWPAQLQVRVSLDECIEAVGSVLTPGKARLRTAVNGLHGLVSVHPNGDVRADLSPTSVWIARKPYDPSPPSMRDARAALARMCSSGIQLRLCHPAAIDELAQYFQSGQLRRTCRYQYEFINSAGVVENIIRTDLDHLVLDSTRAQFFVNFFRAVTPCGAGYIDLRPSVAVTVHGEPEPAAADLLRFLRNLLNAS